MLKRILLTLSGSEHTNSVIEYGINLAIKSKSHLTGLTVLDRSRIEDVGPVPIGGSNAARELSENRIQSALKEAERVEELFKRQALKFDLSHEMIRIEADPINTTLNLARTNDLILTGLHHWFDYGVLETPRDQPSRLVRTGVRPLLGILPSYKPINRVLVAYNGSPESAHTLKQFCLLQIANEASLKIICIGNDSNRAKSLLQEASNYAQAWNHKTESTHIQSGDPSEIILNEAEIFNSDLIVLGSASRSSIGQLVLGDTAKTVVEQSKINLFIDQ